MFQFSKILRAMLVLVVCLPALSLGIFVLTMGTYKFGEVMRQSPLMFQDFVKYYACGAVALSPQRTQAYDAEMQVAVLRSLIGPYTNGVLPQQYQFRTDYPPLVYPVMAPVAMLDLQWAVFGFLLLSIVSAVAGVYLLTGKRAGETALWIAVICCCLFGWRTLAMGQMTWLIMGLMAIFYYLLLDESRKHDWLAGFCLSIAGLKLQYVLFLLVPVIVLRRWKILAAAGIVFAVLLLLTAALMGLPLMLSYPQIASSIENADPYVKSMTCIRALAKLVVPPSWLPVVATAGMVAGLAACAAIWRHVRNAPRETQHWAAAVTLCIALFASQHTHNYDLLLLSIAAMLTFPTLNPITLFKMVPAARRVWNVTLMLFVPISWWAFKIPNHLVVWQASLFTLILVILIAAGMMNMLASSAEERRQPAGIS